MKKTLAFLFFLFANTACQAEVIVPATATIIPTPTSVAFITATLPATPISLPSPTLPPPPSVTPAPPAEGQTTSQLNVRNAPLADGEEIGRLEMFARVQIIGRDPTSAWWMILFPESATGKGWITTEFVQVADFSNVPIIDAGPQVSIQASTTEASSNESVPPLPTSEAPQVLVTAPEDGDSALNPAVNITLSKASIPVLNYANELSSPEGDAHDWVKFGLEGSVGQEKIVTVTSNCSGSGKLNIELLQNGVALQKWENIACGRASQLQLYLYVGAPYSLHFFIVQGNASLSYFSYTLSVQLAK